MTPAPPRFGLAAIVALVSAGIGSAITIAVRSAPSPAVASADRTPPQSTHEAEALRAAIDQLRQQLDALPQELRAALAAGRTREPAAPSAESLPPHAVPELDALVARLERAATPAAIRGRAVRAQLDAQPQPNAKALQSVVGRESSALTRELAFLDLEEIIARFGSPTGIHMGDGFLQLLYTTDDSASGGGRHDLALFFVDGLVARVDSR